MYTFAWMEEAGRVESLVFDFFFGVLKILFLFFPPITTFMLLFISTPGKVSYSM